MMKHSSNPNVKTHSRKVVFLMNAKDKGLMVKNDITLAEYERRIDNHWTHAEAVLVPKNAKYPDILTNGLYPVTRADVIHIYRNANTIDTYRARRAMGWSKHQAMITPKL